MGGNGPKSNFDTLTVFVTLIKPSKSTPIYICIKDKGDILLHAKNSDHNITHKKIMQENVVWRGHF